MSFDAQIPQGALITGASRGIGKAVALTLAQQGIPVALVARSHPDLVAVQTEIKALGGRAKVYPIDLSELSALPQRLQSLLADFGSCDVLVNNAGMAYVGPLATLSLSDWQRVIDLNLTAAFLCAQAVLPGMRQRRFGTIVNVVSIAGKRAFPDWGVYCASKFGLMGFSQALAEEERQHGIRVTSLCPGAVNTPIWDTDTVTVSFDRSKMLSAAWVADLIAYIVRLPMGAVVEDLTLMPTGGAF
ncbi:SDR family oxidoreductase [Synechococcus sp. Nb3U1]|uniref:SDR family oxidoreductase n=1 Tax=Synechococcus sp. Nb3U1 TaxID=1914529 RepID=UPI001F35437F|nr:SDR family oxidoreductase [Synechococcus sp. Nb3U1]MCF2971291.1 SDR family oxidoreductase [Synechococcus sp. Nb3U1]